MDISNLVFLLLHFQSEAVRSHFRFLYRDSMPPDRILCSSPAHHYRNSISPEAPEVQEEIDIDHTLRKLPVRIWQSQVRLHTSLLGGVYGYNQGQLRQTSQHTGTSHIWDFAYI